MIKISWYLFIYFGLRLYFALYIVHRFDTELYQLLQIHSQLLYTCTVQLNELQDAHKSYRFAFVCDR